MKMVRELIQLPAELKPKIDRAVSRLLNQRGLLSFVRRGIQEKGVNSSWASTFMTTGQFF